MTYRRARKTAGLLVGVVLAAAGCSDDDSAAPGPTDAPISTQPGATAPPPDTTAPSIPDTTITTAPPTTTAAADDVTVDEDRLQALLDAWRADVDVYGATLSVRVPGYGDVHLASGVDGRDPETPMSTEGTYDVFSVTKSFTAAAALQLVDEGRLSLDDPVEPWLPELPNADQITLAMLLSHTAGLGTWTGGPDEAADWVDTLIADLGRSFTPDELLAMHAQQPLVGEPGEGRFYTNAAYDAVGVMIERELDQGLAAVIDERFIAPLSLDDTLLSDGSTVATRHGWFSLGGDPDRPDDVLDLPDQTALKTTIWAAGGMISTSDDLLDWGEALYSGDLLGTETTATMLDRDLHIESHCFDPTGCDPDELGLVGKGGGGPWTEVLVTHHRGSGTTIVIHANTEVWPLDRLAVDVVYALGLEEPQEAGAHTTRMLQPTVEFTLPDGWEILADEPAVLALITEDDIAGGVYLIRDPVALHPDPATQAERKRPAEGVGGSADDLVEWLLTHPELDVTERAPVTIGGLDGRQLDMSIAADSTSTPWYCDDVPACVNLFTDDPDADESWIFHLYGPDDAMRVALLTTTDGATVAILQFTFEPGDPTGFLEQAQPLVDSLVVTG